MTIMVDKLLQHHSLISMRKFIIKISHRNLENGLISFVWMHLDLIVATEIIHER